MVKFSITGRIPSKKNSKIIICRGKYPTMLPSKAHQEWHREASRQLNQTPKCKEIAEISIIIFAPDKRKGDLTNKAESLLDLLVDNGIIQDDNWFEIPKLTLIFGGIDVKTPRAEIILT